MKYNVEVDTRLSLSDYFNVVDDLALSYLMASTSRRWDLSIQSRCSTITA